MKLSKRLIGLVLVALLLPESISAGKLIDLTFKKMSHESSKDRQYSLYIPEAYDGRKTLPLVVVLHGCNQTHRDIMHDTRFNDLGELETFFVAYPFITSYDKIRGTNCWGYWIKDEVTEGKGEVADLVGIMRDIQKMYSIDPHRIHITGFGSGGAMANAVMVAYSEIIASGAPAAGVAYGETECAMQGVCLNFSPFDPQSLYHWWSPRFQSSEETVNAMIREMGARKRTVPLLLLHSKSDPEIDITAALNNANAWAALSGVDLTKPISSEKGETKGVSWERSCYGKNDGTSIIETHFAYSSGHAWLGGASGTYSDPNGPDWSVIAWDFFKTHRKDPYQ
jgi:poly(hydroxyalkanoate) depolymerase family esterase